MTDLSRSAILGGTGTSAAVLRLTDFLRTLREDLDLRLISVGRAGFGQSDPARNWTFEDYAGEPTAVLDSLDIDEVIVVAISGGGPYSAAFAAADPDRVLSIHLAAADDGARTFAIAGQKGDGAAEIAEYERYCTLPLPDVSGVEAPVFIYQGMQDPLITPADAERWKEVYPNVVKVREYPDGGHDVQYRHWDQILVDMAGMSDRLVVCEEGESRLVPEDEVTLSRDTTLGVCAWGD